MFRFLLMTLISISFGLTAPSALLSGEPPPRRPTNVPESLRTELKLAPFYQKYFAANGFPILGSAKVDDNALAEAAWIIDHMLEGRDDIRKAMIQQKVRAVIMAKDEYTTDVPEHAFLKPKIYWDRRARGLGATPQAPVVSGAEENLLQYQGDPYPAENIFLHEFAHAIHGTGLNKVDPMFDTRLRAAYQSAKDRGLWKNTYAGTNHSEYWAEGVQCWFDDNAPPDALHNEIRTRAQLKKYDTELARLCEEVFGERPWKYTKPKSRPTEGRTHLPGYDLTATAKFRWRESPPGDHPRVVIETAAGNFEVELDTQASPPAVEQFLRIALNGGFHSSRFDRSTTGGIWTTMSPAKIEKRPKDPEFKPGYASVTVGSIALVGSDTQWSGFMIGIDSKVDTTGYTVVPIGKVVKGNDVVKKIRESLTRAGEPSTPVDVRRVIRME